MAAAKIDGTAIAKSIRQGLKTEIEQIQVSNPRFKPNLVIFQGTHYYPSLNNSHGMTAD
jgi:methylenetetrahydrofolate dehydrogenase (NADP+)/methenyltetrahydrofolate cyclohydrolase/formyltetrahydrofolate synthetase